jgi:starch phosphorylase
LAKLLDRIEKIDRKSLEKAFAHHLEFTVGKNPYNISNLDIYLALAYTIRDHLIDRFNETQKVHYEADTKRIYYISMEFLLGRSLENALFNLGAMALAQKSMRGFGLDPEKIFEEECDPGLGNGGLGRLAACFLDSMATLNLPAIGYGLRYNYGIFKQEIINGYQSEIPDYWLAKGKPWEIERFDFIYPVRFYGYVKSWRDNNNRMCYKWIESEKVNAKAYDIPIPGYGTPTINYLRLWSGEPTKEMEFDFENFNRGDYIGAVEDRIKSQNITAVLYPNDNNLLGRELRLKQEYFLVSASLQDIIWRFKKINRNNWSIFPEKAAIQLNDTHPSLAIPELIRILIDEEGLNWDEAWDICVKTFGYTNHTILSEALETWPVSILERLLPRHMQIIYEINSRFIDDIIESKPEHRDLIPQLSIIEEGQDRRVRMANLSIIGSHSLNGVAELHSKLLKERIFSHFYKLFPEKFQNKTNGITQRRWLAKCNIPLSRLITKTINSRNWIVDLDLLSGLQEFANDRNFQDKWLKVKEKNKQSLAEYVKDRTGYMLDPSSIFSIQAKRIHEYKRQLLNILGVIDVYFRLKDKSIREWTPKSVLFAGKAAPGYYSAKLIIKLINDVAKVINNDDQTKELLQVVFIPDYNVSVAERIIPAADLSEQISTAGTEASGTGNMKFALNGAITIGTLDGANIEIRDEVGENNIYIFGLNTSEVEDLRKKSYNPWDYYSNNPNIKTVLDAIRKGFFNKNNKDEFKPIFDILTSHGDYYMHLIDFKSYQDTQFKINKDYNNRELWGRKSILNSARIGKFSSDRTIKEYARDIWNVKPIEF